MERTVFLLFLLSGALLEVRCLECYVCDNCANVKLKEIQTCGPTATSRPSTSSITTMKPVSSSTGAAEIRTTFSVPTSKDPIPIVTKPTTESSSSPMTITTDSITTLTTTTELPSTSMSSTTEAITTSPTTATTPFTYSTTAAEESTTAATVLTIMEPINTSTITTIPTSASQTTTIEPEILLTTITETGISTLATANENTTISEPTIPISFTAPTAGDSILISTGNNPDPLSSFTATSTETTNERTDTVSETIISHLITTKLPPTFTPFISDLEPLTSFTGTEPPVQTISSVPKISEPLSSFTATEPVVQTISSEPTILAPIASMSMESIRRPNISVAYPQTTSANIVKPVLDTNSPSGIRRIRSVPEDCLCTDEKCDCPTTHQISKRYAVRGLALSKNIGKYVCVVDKYKINETEVTKRGCAIIEEDEQTSCVNAGFGANCKLCDTDQCNSGAILQSSILIMFTLFLVNSF